MSTESQVTTEDCVERLRVLANTTRMAVVRQLMTRGPQHVGQLNAAIEIEQSLLSHHLRVLREAGLVDSQRDGKAVRYRIADDLTVDAHHIDLGCCQLRFHSGCCAPRE